nr:succinate:cytochrome c oxidoreductase subunit 3 [Cyanidioschyzonaceae sp. 1 FvB-2021]
MKDYVNRPISPHLTVYNVEWNSIFSIFHRVSGVMIFLFLFLFIFLIFLLKFYSSSNILFILLSFIFENFFLIFISVIFFLSLIFFYHLCTGIYHLLLEFGYFCDTTTIDVISKNSLIFSIFISTLYYIYIYLSLN